MLRDQARTSERLGSGVLCRPGLADGIKVGRAVGVVRHICDGKVIWEQRVENLKTKAGIDFLFAQGYGSSGGQANGLCYIGLSNDAVTETVDSTTLSNEIAANGLARAIGTYAHAAGASTCTISKTFTATGAVSCQKAALFSAAAGGSMTHVLSFTQRSLAATDQLAVTFTITLT